MGLRDEGKEGKEGILQNFHIFWNSQVFLLLAFESLKAAAVGMWLDMPKSSARVKSIAGRGTMDRWCTGTLRAPSATAL